jgi:hypothetical protein
MGNDDNRKAWAQFRETVNMTPRELEKWLDTAESKSVGQKRDSQESTGHASGRRIVEILRTKREKLTSDDYAHTRKVVDYAKRHLAQRPDGVIEDTV